MTSPVRISHQSVLYNQIGIDSITQIGRYNNVLSSIEKMGLKLFTPKRKSRNKTQKRIDYDLKQDVKTRYNGDQFKPVIELVKLPSRGRNKNLLMVIVRYVPILLDVATHHRTTKGTYCLVMFNGLHQPTYNINREAMKIISTFLKKKTFKLYSLDIATDTHDTRTIDYQYKESFTKALEPFSKHGVMKPPNGGTSLTIRQIEHSSNLSRINLYDKSNKQASQQKHKDIKPNWKRLEDTFTLDVMQKNSYSFSDYVLSTMFQGDLMAHDEVCKKKGIRNYDNTFLDYQLNSLLDNRNMNNRASTEQFNSVEALERFRESESIYKRVFN